MQHIVKPIHKTYSIFHGLSIFHKYILTFSQVWLLYAKYNSPVNGHAKVSLREFEQPEQQDPDVEIPEGVSSKNRPKGSNTHAASKS